MKVRATYRHVFNVTREVEVDEVEFKKWADERYLGGYDFELAMACWLDAQDDEFTSEVFSDWRVDRPLPADFELQFSDVEDVALNAESQDSQS